MQIALKEDLDSLKEKLRTSAFHVVFFPSRYKTVILTPLVQSAPCEPFPFFHARVNSGVESEGFFTRTTEAERGSQGQTEDAGGPRDRR